MNRGKMLIEMSESKARLKTPSNLESEQTANPQENDENHSDSKNGRNNVFLRLMGNRICQLYRVHSLSNRPHFCWIAYQNCQNQMSRSLFHAMNSKKENMS